MYMYTTNFTSLLHLPIHHTALYHKTPRWSLRSRSHENPNYLNSITTICEENHVEPPCLLHLHIPINKRSCCVGLLLYGVTFGRFTCTSCNDVEQRKKESNKVSWVYCSWRFIVVYICVYATKERERNKGTHLTKFWWKEEKRAMISGNLSSAG